MTGVLSRSKDNALVGGVCGGLSVFLDVNPTIVRLFFILLLFGHGIGAMLYFLLWIIIPIDGQVECSLEPTLAKNGYHGASDPISTSDQIGRVLQEPQAQLGILLGSALILGGIISLLPNLQISLPKWFSFDLIWPVFLLVGGLALLIRRPREVKTHD